MTDMLVVDNSLLRDTICTTRVLLRHKHGYTSRDDSAALRAGSTAHAALATFFDPNDDGASNFTKAGWALAVLKREYETWSRANVPPDNRLSYENVSRILAAWFDAHPVDSFAFRVRHVETGFSFVLTNWLTICGRIDMDAEMSDGTTYVIDHKSTGNITPWWLAGFRLDSQFSTYVSGMMEHLGGAKVAGGIVNAIEFSKIPSSNTKCRQHGVVYAECGVQHVVERSQMITVDRSPAQLAQWRRDAIKNARKYRDACEMYPELSDITRAPMEGTFYGACTNCSFKDFCEAGRPMDLVDSMLVHDPWSPFEHSQTGQTSTKEK